MSVEYELKYNTYAFSHFVSNSFIWMEMLGTAGHVVILIPIFISLMMVGVGCVHLKIGNLNLIKSIFN
jgi:hypothetical protein